MTLAVTSNDVTMTSWICNRTSTGCGMNSAVAAAAGGPDAEALADRLTAPLDSAIRLALLEALSDAAEQITRELAPASVDVRLRGRDPEFTVSAGVDELAEPVAAVPGVRRRRRHVAGDAAAAGEPAVAASTRPPVQRACR